MEPPGEYKLLTVIDEEISTNSENLNPQVNQLVQAFLKYLKEPRYQSPLTLTELARLFSNFYKDLNSLVINLYTQSNSVKKQLISSSECFRSNPKDFDYLLAIANYSLSSVKLLKRSDPEAVLQLRVFNYYKFLTIFESIENAQASLFNSSNNIEEGIPLLEKIFKFDQQDIILQEFLDEKLEALKELKLPFSCFIENDQNDKLSSFFASISDPKVENATLNKIKKHFIALNESITPSSKLKEVVEIQKSLIILLSEAHEKDHSSVNNDDIIPSLIYLIIYHIPFSSCELYLNFTFIKNFVNLIDPYKVDISSFTLNSSFSAYTPTDRLNRSLNGNNNGKRGNLFELLNLKEDDETSLEAASNITFFDSDRDLAHYIQRKYLNNGELKFYLTNFEAVLFFLSSVTLKELIPEATTNKELLRTSLHEIVDEELLNHFKFPDGKAIQEFKNQEDTSQLSAPRSRSSSLFNTISHKLNDVALSVNRSRSNSSIMTSLKSSSLSLSKESFPTFANNHEAESSNGPPLNPSETSNVDGNNNISSLMMRNILGRFSSVSVPQIKPNADEQDTAPGGAVNSDNKIEYQDKGTILNKLSPNHSRTRSSSLEAQINTGANHQKKNSITSKLTNGVSDFMTKFNNTNNGSFSTLVSSPNKNTSSLSLHSSVDDQVENVSTSGNIQQQSLNPNDSSVTIQARPDYSRNRTTSLQIMDKWFNNISANNNNNSNNLDNQDTQLNTTEASNNKADRNIAMKELTKYNEMDFESLTITDLKNLKDYYDKLCYELISSTDPRLEQEEPIDIIEGSDKSL